MFFKRQDPGNPMHDQPVFQPSSTPDAGLTGAKVGVGIGITHCASLISEICFLRRRRRHHQDRKKPTEPKPKFHELITNSNCHELPTESNTHEIAQEKPGVMNTSELEPSSQPLKSKLREQGQAAPYELAIEPTATPAVAAPSSSRETDSISRNLLAPSTARGAEGGGMQSVPDIVERIRVKKERLKQLLEANQERHDSEKARRAKEETGRSDNGLSFDKEEKLVWTLDRDTSCSPR
ncbi:hypothetical protein N431DRAFT_501358 [Stipitochalara longipes BDJ]|nr:hypothetical protein N431DRAFT_501358 [Stipitochalara longipes BDJ]